MRAIKATLTAANDRIDAAIKRHPRRATAVGALLIIAAIVVFPVSRHLILREQQVAQQVYHGHVTAIQEYPNYDGAGHNEFTATVISGHVQFLNVCCVESGTSKGQAITVWTTQVTGPILTMHPQGLSTLAWGADEVSTTRFPPEVPRLYIVEFFATLAGLIVVVICGLATILWVRDHRPA
jgi:hypothetical protein